MKNSGVGGLVRMRVACAPLPVTAVAVATMNGVHRFDDNRYGDDLF